MKSPIVPLAAAALLALASAGPATAIEKGTREKAQASNLKPGQFVWEPQASPEGPIDIVISLARQRLYVYRNGVPIGRSTISSGSKGRGTPPGVYMILEKNLTHHSNKYHEASMPYMERLTWGGLAIHAGNLPGYPESHGCVHVPLDFAKELYGVSEIGDAVLIANGETKPAATADPNLLFSEPSAAAPTPAPDAPLPTDGSPAPTAAAPDASSAMPSASPSAMPSASPEPSPAAAPAFTWQPDASPHGPVSIVFTSADKHIYVFRKGVEIGRADIGGPDAGHPYGNYVYVSLSQAFPDGTRQWKLLGTGDGSPPPDLQTLAKTLTVTPEFRQKMQGIIVPGTTLVITDQRANPTKPSNPD